MDASEHALSDLAAASQQDDADCEDADCEVTAFCACKNMQTTLQAVSFDTTSQRSSLVRIRHSSSAIRDRHLQLRYHLRLQVVFVDGPRHGENSEDPRAIPVDHAPARCFDPNELVGRAKEEENKNKQIKNPWTRPVSNGPD
ncbi:hypothetical protein ACFX13_012904 [Malus domestica]|uniref:Uncharacterized protein n=1 Tax=Malus domestica TaxID=3750 RepID=A0A498I7U8_MALDO|nr:hypothetical protein DVH24_001800 [Malus domestica]